MNVAVPATRTQGLTEAFGNAMIVAFVEISVAIAAAIVKNWMTTVLLPKK